MTYFLDTNICIYALKGKYPRITFHLAKHMADQIKIPAMVKAELLFGAQKSRQSAKTHVSVAKFLFPFEVVPFDDACVTEYVFLRQRLEKKGKPIGPNDMVIAATVLANSGILITHNTKEFQRIPSLKVQDWTQ